MHQLPNNCRVGKFSFFPKNWKTVSANKNLDWRISYWFYDDDLKEKKQVVVKGMNRAETLEEKRVLIKQAEKDEKKALEEGYNPIRNSFSEEPSGEIHPSTPFIAALRQALEKIHCVHTTKIDIKSTIKFIEKSATNLNYNLLPISEIRRKHIKRILENCASTKDKWSDNTYNAYRKNLGILFLELIEQEAMETNIIRDLRKQKTIRKIKRLPTNVECVKIDAFAKKYDRRFWLLIHLFFHSGCRTTEIFKVKFEHVDIEEQTVLFTILKGNQPFEVRKPIKNIAVKFWKEAMKGAKPGDYIFGKGLLPSPISINPRQATKRWKLHIKEKLKIDCDWYALKYLNTDQISELRGLKTAALLNSHKNLTTTKIYAVNEERRMNKEIRQMKNKLA